MKESGAEGDRTLNLCIANAALSQLSYGPVEGADSTRPGGACQVAGKSPVRYGVS